MTIEEKIKFLKDNIEPLSDQIYGNGYRASAYMTDGTFIPCVRFRNSKPITELAVKRFNDERKGKSIFSRDSGMGYKDIVKTFVASGNRINEYDIDRIEKSPCAFPKEILDQIQGETTMGWTGFCVKMTDGKIFGYGSSFLFDFFQMPNGYSANDIKEIINHSYLSKDGDLKEHKVPFFDRPDDYDERNIYRERQYFECYIDGL
ncbi:hypothetical protein [Flavobacterium sp. SM2513]|uniref:hypothetical protein n=1 Tax=Flavobacterium sp. SM2513 TaxID=3424766 RepID=UPI003D7F6195